MTSQLNVDTIVDKAGSGGTNITVGNDATYVAEGGSTNSHNVVQGLCKAWAFVNGSDGSLRDSFNYSSVTDNVGSGDFSYGFTNNMRNANYSIAAMANSGSNMGVTRGSNLTTGHDINVFNTSDSGSSTACSFMVQGDLA